MCAHVCVVRMYECMYACMHACVLVCTDVCMYACPWACMHACMSVCMCVQKCVCVCVCAYIYMHACVIYVCAHMPTFQVLQGPYVMTVCKSGGSRVLGSAFGV